MDSARVPEYKESDSSRRTFRGFSVNETCMSANGKENSNQQPIVYLAVWMRVRKITTCINSVRVTLSEWSPHFVLSLDQTMVTNYFKSPKNIYF